MTAWIHLVLKLLRKCHFMFTLKIQIFFFVKDMEACDHKSFLCRMQQAVYSTILHKFWCPGQDTVNMACLYAREAQIPLKEHGNHFCTQWNHFFVKTVVHLMTEYNVRLIMGLCNLDCLAILDIAGFTQRQFNKFFLSDLGIDGHLDQIISFNLNGRAPGFFWE